MAIDFPASPTLNQTFSSGNTNYIWDGTKWTASVTGGISLDKIEKGNTKAEVVDTGSDGRFVVTTEGSENLVVASNGDVTITDKIIHSGDTNTAIRFPAADTVSVETNGSERARIDSSGRLLVGTSTSLGDNAQLQIANSAGITTNPAEFLRASNDAAGSYILLTKSRGSHSAPLEVSNGDFLGAVVFKGYDGAAFQDAAYISGQADGTWTDSGDTSDNPGRLVFSTTADGASSPTERMRITNSGEFLFNTTSNFGALGGAGSGGLGIIFEGATGRGLFVASGNSPLIINRTTNDGDLITFRQDGTQEGTISVSGTTVSYNGAHLSRWSQLPSGAERTEILRGTVLSNIDEMCKWGDENNEQLNRMKVSDVEGDKNVSGVFQAWDDDDDTYTNDFYCAMTGDFVIRIAAGVTVERGDLLMSAGDGTAKPQDDDIIRSKTIAKVTSTNVSCTYDDGSYCVPCVLMAC